MEGTVIEKETPIQSIHEEVDGSPISLALESFGSTDERVQVNGKDLTTIELAVKLLAQQNTSAGTIRFVTQESQQGNCLSSANIALEPLHEATAIHTTPNKDDVFQSFQIQNKVAPDLLGLQNVSSKSKEDAQRLKFISKKLKAIKENINELYKKAGVTTIALSAFDGNVTLTGPEHMSSLEENGMLKNIFWNTVINLDVTREGKSNDRNNVGKGEASVQQWQCHECHSIFTTQHTLINHQLLSHSGLPVHKCAVCFKEFIDAALLQKHMTTHTERNEFHCKVCGNSFAAKNLLNAHMKIHNGSKTVTCKICSKSFRSASSLQYHMNKHTGSNKCVCKHCNKEFTKTSSLKVHMRIHSGEQPYSCQECGKSFIVSTHLTRHLRVHSGERPYLCEVCGKRFNRSSHLRIHMRIHSGEKPYECEICGKRFNQTVTRKKHLKTHANVT